jgi:hypothetical protein
VSSRLGCGLPSRFFPVRLPTTHLAQQSLIWPFECLARPYHAPCPSVNSYLIELMQGYQAFGLLKGLQQAVLPGELSRYRNELWGGGPGFYFRKDQDFSLLHSVQTALGSTQPPVQWVPGGKTAGGEKLTTHLHLVPRSRMMELYRHSPTRLHGVVLN